MVRQLLALHVARVTSLWGVCPKSLGATRVIGYQAIQVLVGQCKAKGFFRCILHSDVQLAVIILRALSFPRFAHHRLAAELAT